MSEYVISELWSWDQQEDGKRSSISSNQVSMKNIVEHNITTKGVQVS